MKKIIESFNHAMHESKNTVGADINEIAFGYYAAGSSWDIFQNAEYAKQKLNERMQQASPEETNVQQQRAKAMLEATMEWAEQNGWEGNITKVWWTARPGVLSQAVGKKVSSGNPTDILLQFDNDEFLGISAKSTKGKADIGFKNPGVRPITKALGVDLNPIIQRESSKAIVDLNIPKMSNKARKKFLRSDEVLKTAADEVGRRILGMLRDGLYSHLESMEDDDIRNHILQYWMDAGANYPYYIKVTGRGTEKSGYTASLSDPIKNEKYKALMSEEISVSKVGSDSIGISAGGIRIMKMRFKYESQKLASSLKMSGDPWK